MRKIYYINKIVISKMEENVFKKYKDVYKSSYNNFIFKIKDPISNKILKEYEIKENDFKKFSFKEKNKYKSMEKEIVFDEKEYEKEYEKQEKIKKIYMENYEKYYQEEAIKEGIDEKVQKIFTDVMSNVLDMFDFSGFGGDEMETRSEFEQDIINSIKSNI